MTDDIHRLQVMAGIMSHVDSGLSFAILIAFRGDLSIGTQAGPLSTSKRDPFCCGLDETSDVSLFGG
jgi:hypothetical protein